VRVLVTGYLDYFQGQIADITFSEVISANFM
jgi:hypothetical protein